MNSNGDFKLKDTMNHDEIAEFIKPWLKKNNIYTLTYKCILLGGLTVIGIYFGYISALEGFQIEYISEFFLGGALAFLVIPFHEWLHGIAYKMVGAPSVVYRAHWKKLVFYAATDGFRAGFKEFRIVALMPFVVISILGILVILASGFAWTTYLTGFTLFHAAFCGGDFGLLSYMYEHKNQGIITVDDLAKRETQFLITGSEIA